jgi:hypothetical protein
MSDSRDGDATRDLRAERGDAALVAQYIHELSERHRSERDPAATEEDGLDDGGSAL